MLPLHPTLRSISSSCASPYLILRESDLPRKRSQVNSAALSDLWKIKA
uniref:Uncharacterized protein n=1 Tax=Arundo donax TaxID=35708 RepID=A0A0A9B168_ARUDO